MLAETATLCRAVGICSFRELFSVAVSVSVAFYAFVVLVKPAFTLFIAYGEFWTNVFFA